MIMAIRFIEIQKKKMSVEKWDKNLADMMEKEKKYSVEMSPFPTVFFQRRNRSSYTSRNRYTSTASIFHLFAV